MWGRHYLYLGASPSNNAGVTLYSVGTVKEIPGVRTYVAVDGGMSDNLRPMLYGARYEALIAAHATPGRAGGSVVSHNVNGRSVTVLGGS